MRKEGEGGGGSDGRDYRGWVPVTRRRRRQRSLDGAPSMLINPFAHAVYRVHALIKRGEPAITIIPRICSDFLGRTSERRPWMDGWTLPIKRSRENKKRKKRKERRNDRFDFLVRGNSLVGRNFWRRGGGGGGEKKQAELIRLFASRETFREWIKVQRVWKCFSSLFAHSISLSLSLSFRVSLWPRGEK